MALADLRQAAMAVRRALSQCTDMRPDSSAWCSTDTPYGKVCVESDVHGSSHQLTVYAVADVRFISLCMHCQCSGRHIDKAVPGNGKHPDGGRGTQCVYWTCLEVPAWFQSRRCGWPPFTYILQNDLKSAEVIDLQLMRLWSVEPNMTTGFGLPNGERIWNCKGKCCVSIADWEQYVRGFDLMGYLALLPCGYCMNVVGRRPDFDDPVFVHILSHEYHRFQLHTPEILFEAADEVQRIAEEEPVRLAVQQTSIGIEYYKEGLLFDKWSRAKLQPLMFGDWMHTFYGSGVFCNRGLRQILP